MVSSDDQKSLIYNIKLSSVGPSRVTGTDVARELTGVDLAMKLHYLKCIYFFSSQACEGLSIPRIKEGLFYWSNEYYMISGRYRRTEAGRPYLKCNDCGLRMAEAQCDLTMEEWLEMKDNGSLSNDLLIYHLPIGPELFFSPPCCLQVTKFRCGGMSFGVSWAHVLGDAFSASDCISGWTRYLAGLRSNDPLTFTPPPRPLPPELATEPLSIKQVDPVGDHWVTPNSSKMASFSIALTASQASHLQAQVGGGFPFFESVCAVIWQCIAKVRDGLEPNTVTLCKKDPGYVLKPGSLTNLGQVIGSVRAEFPVAASDLKKLVLLLVDMVADERGLIEAALDKDDGVKDYVVYGGNLTFVNFEEANLYGLEWNGTAPQFAHFGIQGVGDAGAVWVLPRSKNIDNGSDGGAGKIVTVVLPENEAAGLKLELKESGLPVDVDL